MTTRRLTSRKVVLTAAFITLAAGGTAACDASSSDDAPVDVDVDVDVDAAPAPVITTSSPTPRPSATSKVPKPRATTSAPAEDAFYCADEGGTVVEEYYCDPDDGYDGSSYFLWHSSRYQRGYDVGTLLPRGGKRLAPDNETARVSAGLPSYGVIGNGSIKTNIVGARSGSAGLSSGGDTDTGSDSAGG